MYSPEWKLSVCLACQVYKGLAARYIGTYRENSGELIHTGPFTESNNRK